MALYRTVTTDPANYFSTYFVTVENKISGERQKAFDTWNGNAWETDNPHWKVVEWLEAIEPSPDIQKRAEEILKSELRDYFKHSFKEDRLDKVVENAFYIKEEYACVISAMQKLATEAVAAEREKYEKEISELKSKLQDCEHKIAIEAQIAEEVKEAVRVVSEENNRLRAKNEQWREVNNRNKGYSFDDTEQ